MAQQSVTVLDVSVEDCPEQFRHLCNEDGLLVEATVWAEMVRNDYGVHGSPVWYDPEIGDIDFEINGIRVKDVPDELNEMAYDAAIEKGEWE
jgi:hypothetical protein